MSTWKVILATLVIFGAGVVTGGLLMRHAERIDIPPPQHNSALRPGALSSAGGLRLEFLRRAQHELDLNPAQRERIDKLMKESQERTRNIMEPVAPDLRAELERTKDEFQQVLTPEQRRRFEELVKKQQQRPQRHPTGGRGERAIPTNTRPQ